MIKNSRESVDARVNLQFCFKIETYSNYMLIVCRTAISRLYGVGHTQLKQLIARVREGSELNTLDIDDTTLVSKELNLKSIMEFAASFGINLPDYPKMLDLIHVAPRSTSQKQVVAWLDTFFHTCGDFNPKVILLLLKNRNLFGNIISVIRVGWEASA